MMNHFGIINCQPHRKLGGGWFRPMFDKTLCLQKIHKEGDPMFTLGRGKLVSRKAGGMVVPDP